MFSLRAVTRCAPRLPPPPPSCLLTPPRLLTTAPHLRTSPLLLTAPLRKPFPPPPYHAFPPPLARARHTLPPSRRPPPTLYTDPTGTHLSTARPLFTRSHLHRALRSRTTYLLLFLLSGSAVLFYFSHLETVPVTGRTRFNLYSSPSSAATVRQAGDEQTRRILYEMERQGIAPLPGWDFTTRRVRRVLERLLPFSGLDPDGRRWEVYVIPDSGVNAFVLPGGRVFVHAGLLEVARGDGGLAAVLGHEIAHVVADHVGERMSAEVGRDVVLWTAMLVVGMIGLGPTLMHYYGGRVLEVAFERPMSRAQEREADFIGLMMMSEACFDPREAVGFWERMSRREKREGEVGEVPEWMSTHPSNEKRVEAMREWLPKAMEKREESDCRTTASFAEGFRRALGRGVIVVV